MRVQIDDEVRDATEEEIAAYESHSAAAISLAEQATQTQAAKASALAKLEALGLTTEEAQAIAGI